MGGRHGVRCRAQLGGSLMPYSVGARRLLILARELGFQVFRYARSGRHVLLVHTRSGEIACLPLMVSESGRNFDNYRLQLIRAADVRTRTEDDASTHARTFSRPTGEAIERAARISARLDNCQRERAAVAIERRNQQLKFYSRLMGGWYQ